MESMQTPDGLQLDDPEIYRFGCIPGGLHLDSRNPSGLQVESNWSMWGSVKYMLGVTCHTIQDTKKKCTMMTILNTIKGHLLGHPGYSAISVLRIQAANHLP